jgi:hypothetical protein
MKWVKNTLFLFFFLNNIIGTIRIFNYPCESGTGNGYMMCYSDHLNNIN